MNSFRLWKAVRIQREFCRSSRFIHNSMSLYQNTPINYEKWTKRQLINKILQLEQIETKNEEKTEELEQVPILNGAVKAKLKKQLVFTKENTRLVGLKFSYLGWPYQGLAIQKEETVLPTVEQKIMEALHQVKMVPTLDVSDCEFSRCGRTDKGVSAMNQVISLRIRSSLSVEERQDPGNDAREMDYINILNQVLPEDIRLHAVCLRPPPDFDARFSCRFRHYKYIFDSTNLDLQAMAELAKKFEGIHDFRNFCKVDGAKQITNFEREIFSALIVPLGNGTNSKYYIFDLKGRAFLWHQVRCMVAILLMVGQNLEQATIIDDLLDIVKYPKKPQYIMANDLPLILYDCQFDDDVKWIPTQVNSKSSRANNNFKGVQFDYNLRSIIFDIMNDVAIKPFDKELESKIRLHYGDGKGKYVNKNVPICERGTVGTPDQINEKWRIKHQKRKTMTEDI